MTGPPTALDTSGGITVFEVEPTALIGIALMTIFLTLRHTRQDEEAGRTELLRAGVLGRNADLAAIGLAQSVVDRRGPGHLADVPGRRPAHGGFALFAGIGRVRRLRVHGSRFGRGRPSACCRDLVAALGIMFVIRAVGDVNESWLTWVSPIGWAQKIGSFGDDELVAARPDRPSCARPGHRRGLAHHPARRRFRTASAARRQPARVTVARRTVRAVPSAAAWCADGLDSRGRADGGRLRLSRPGRGGHDRGERGLENLPPGHGWNSIVEAYFATVFMINALLATGFTISSALRLRSRRAPAREHSSPRRASVPAGRLTSLAVLALGTTIVLFAGGLGQEPPMP